MLALFVALFSVSCSGADSKTLTRTKAKDLLNAFFKDHPEAYFQIHPGDSEIKRWMWLLPLSPFPVSYFFTH